MRLVYRVAGYIPLKSESDLEINHLIIKGSLKKTKYKDKIEIYAKINSDKIDSLRSFLHNLKIVDSHTFYDNVEIEESEHLIFRHKKYNSLSGETFYLQENGTFIKHSDYLSPSYSVALKRDVNIENPNFSKFKGIYQKITRNIPSDNEYFLNFIYPVGPLLTNTKTKKLLEDNGITGLKFIPLYTRKDKNEEVRLYYCTSNNPIKISSYNQIRIDPAIAQSNYLNLSNDTKETLLDVNFNKYIEETKTMALSGGGLITAVSKKFYNLLKTNNVSGPDYSNFGVVQFNY